MLIKSPDLFRSKSGTVKPKDWTDYLFEAIFRETGKKWKPIANEVALWSRVFKTRIGSGIDPFVLALMIDTIAIKWDSHAELTPWQLTAAENIFRFFMGKGAWFWRSVWFSRYAKGEKETSLYIEYLIKAEVAYNLENGTLGKRNLRDSCKRILSKFEEKVIERRKDERPTFELHWVKERYSEWNN